MAVFWLGFVQNGSLQRYQTSVHNSRDTRANVLQTMAFWELAYISQSFEIRRKAIYQEIDRDSGSTWAQLLTLCLNEVKAIQTRIKVFQGALPARPTPEPARPVGDYQHGVKPPKSDNVITPVKQDPSLRGLAKSRINNFVKTQGSHPGASNPAKRIIDKGALEIRDRANLQPRVIRDRVGGYAAVFLQSRAGAPFRQTFQRRVTAVVCGSPYSRLSIISDAITAISKLGAHSISEDQPGQVQKDIPALARNLAEALRDIEAFLASTEPHWTDVEFQEVHRRSAVEVESVIESLRDGLEELLRAFGEYFGSMDVSTAEVARWRAAVGRDRAGPRTPDMARAAG
jgi:nucleoporin NDC1